MYERKMKLQRHKNNKKIAVKQKDMRDLHVSGKRNTIHVYEK
jgi:hypothetical protein